MNNDDLGVDTGVVPLSTSIAPGHNPLQLAVAHDGATRVTLTESVSVRPNQLSKHDTQFSLPLRYSAAHLARVLASLQVTSAEHGICDHAWVGVLTVPVGQDGDVQALQLVPVSSW